MMGKESTDLGERMLVVRKKVKAATEGRVLVVLSIHNVGTFVCGSLWLERKMRRLSVRVSASPNHETCSIPTVSYLIAPPKTIWIDDGNGGQHSNSHPNAISGVPGNDPVIEDPKEAKSLFVP